MPRRRSAIWKAATRLGSCSLSPDRSLIPFGELKVDALLVSGLPNIRYLSGFSGDNALLLISPDSRTLFTHPRFTIQASEECTCTVKTVGKGPLDAAVVASIHRKRFKRIGFEASRTLYDVHQRMKESLPLGASLKPLGPVIERLRMIKSAEEVACIRRSVLTNSQAFAHDALARYPG